MNDELYDQLEQAMAEAENSKRDAFEESIRHRKAEKYAIEAKRRVNFNLLSQHKALIIVFTFINLLFVFVCCLFKSII